ncbi:MAG: hypothetical protein K6E50_04385 [Lachnospiraceae bacterium]|nr:hypothetical protein [Lachnospiraceae bacterium]
MKRIILILTLSLCLLAGCGKGGKKVVTLTPATDLNPGESIPDPAAVPQAPVYVPEQEMDCRITVSNLTGRDLKQLNLSFTEGSLGTVEILQGETLYDGRQVAWEEESLSVVQEKQGVRIGVRAVASDGSELSFSEITLPDLSSTNLVLVSDDAGDWMFLQ